MMRSVLSIFIISLLPLLLLGGCRPAAPTDAPVKAALEAVIQTDQFTADEKNAFESVTVHNEEAKVWLKANFSTDQPTITAVAKHIGEVFAKTFYDTAMEKKYLQPKYNIELWMRVTTDKGTHNALVAEYFYNLQRNKVEGKAYGLGEVKEIR